MTKYFYIICLAVLMLFAMPTAAQIKHPQEGKGLQSQNSDVAAKIEFHNTANQTVKIYWIDFAGKRVLYSTLLADEVYAQESFVTHPWLVTDAKGNSWALHQPQAFVKAGMQKIVIAAPTGLVAKPIQTLPITTKQ